MLTNLLPDSNGDGGRGNGTYTLHAIAYDPSGNRADFGDPTISVDNRDSVLPFGTIDTPAQGDTASGTAYTNFGWALTPQPNVIPFDGSTIWVYIDGQVVAHPTYNQYRADIAGLFPGLQNSNGAIGFYIFDTTPYIPTNPYGNALHTISWAVYDNVGHGQGIGSRWFSVGPVWTAVDLPTYYSYQNPQATQPQNGMYQYYISQQQPQCFSDGTISGTTPPGGSSPDNITPYYPWWWSGCSSDGNCSTPLTGTALYAYKPEARNSYSISPGQTQDYFRGVQFLGKFSSAVTQANVSSAFFVSDATNFSGGFEYGFYSRTDTPVAFYALINANCTCPNYQCFEWSTLDTEECYGFLACLNGYEILFQCLHLLGVNSFKISD